MVLVSIFLFKTRLILLGVGVGADLAREVLGKAGLARAGLTRTGVEVGLARIGLTRTGVEVGLARVGLCRSGLTRKGTCLAGGLETEGRRTFGATWPSDALFGVNENVWPHSAKELFVFFSSVYSFSL